MKTKDLVWIIVLSNLALAACGPANNATPSVRSVEGILTGAEAASQLPATCRVTTPQNPAFVPPPPYAGLSAGGFWYGSDALWTDIPVNGEWSSLPHGPDGYSQKVFWWSADFSVESEPEPQLLVSGRRLDGPAPALVVSDATNAFASDIGSAMLVGVDLPAAGCWEIDGRYRDASLTFVVRVAP